MSMEIHERPGVYSVYDASRVVSGNSRSKTAAVAAGWKNHVGEVLTFTRSEEAMEALGESAVEDDLPALICLLLKNGAAAVTAAIVAENGGKTDYEAAFEQLEELEGIDIVVCGSTDAEIQQAMRDSVCAASNARRERIAVAAPAKGESVTGLIAQAAKLNSERVILVGCADGASSGVAMAAAAAGAIAGEADPAVPLSGAELSGVSAAAKQYTDNEIDRLVQGGVTPLECVGGGVSVVRGVTTRTKTGEASDETWREISTILIVDDVIPAVRNALRSKFRRAKNTAQTRGAIRSQVILELENKKSREIITEYGEVTVEAMKDTPTACLVEFSFSVTSGLNQICLTAHITV